MLVGIKKKYMKRIDIILDSNLRNQFVDYLQNSEEFLDWCDNEMENTQPIKEDYEFSIVIWRYLEDKLDSFIDDNNLSVVESYLSEDAEDYFQSISDLDNLYKILAYLEHSGLDVEQLAEDCNYMQEKYIW